MALVLEEPFLMRPVTAAMLGRNVALLQRDRLFVHSDDNIGEDLRGVHVRAARKPSLRNSPEGDATADQSGDHLVDLA